MGIRKTERERRMGINPLPRPAASASAELPRGVGFFKKIIKRRRGVNQEEK